MKYYLVAAIANLILISICNYFGRKIQFMLGENGIFVAITALGIASIIPIFILKKPLKYYYLTIILCATALNEYLTNFPVEKTHIPLYGIFSYLVGSALSFRFSKQHTALLTFIICLVIGTIEEMSQHFIPDRFYDPRDIFLNFCGICFGVVASVILRNQGERDFD